MWIVIDCISEYVTNIVLRYAYVLETCGRGWDKIQATAKFQCERGYSGEYVWRAVHEVVVKDTNKSDCVEVVPLMLQGLQRCDVAFFEVSTDYLQMLWGGQSVQDLPHLLCRFVALVDVPLDRVYAFRRGFKNVCPDKLLEFVHHFEFADHSQDFAQPIPVR